LLRTTASFSFISRMEGKVLTRAQYRKQLHKQIQDTLSTNMHDFFTKVKNVSLATKVKGEVALLDRESKVQRQAFGVELYDLLESMTVSQPLGGSVSFLGTQSQQIKQVYDACQLDVRKLQDEQEAKRQEMEHLQVNRERALPVNTNQEKLQRAGQWVSSHTNETKLRAEITLLDRKIKSRKEVFGLDVFDLILDPVPGTSPSAILNEDSEGRSSILGGVKDGIVNQLSKLSSDEKKIQQCIEKAKSDHALIQQRKERKEREILRLKQETSA